MKNLIGKGKYAVMVVNQQHIKLEGRLKDKSCKISCIHDKQLRGYTKQKDVKYDVKNNKWGRSIITKTKKKSLGGLNSRLKHL